MNIVQIIKKDNLFICGKGTDLIIYLKTLSLKYKTLKELIDDKLNA